MWLPTPRPAKRASPIEAAFGGVRRQP